jgi:hypothetical protein
VFKQIAFQSTNEEDLYVLEAVGRDIAIKCKGLPLAAHAVGSMLRNKSVDFWKATRDSTTWHKSSSHGDVLPSLRLSYEHMPFYLKPCFSYCAIFSKGRAMDKDKLIQQWIALDFVKPALPTLSHKVQAEEYLRELLATSLLQYSVSSLVSSYETVMLSNCLSLQVRDICTISMGVYMKATFYPCESEIFVAYLWVCI